MTKQKNFLFLCGHLKILKKNSNEKLRIAERYMGRFNEIQIIL